MTLQPAPGASSSQLHPRKSGATVAVAEDCLWVDVQDDWVRQARSNNRKFESWRRAAECNQRQEDIDRFRIKSRAAALFSQLPDCDMDEAREILAEFLRLVKDAGLKGRTARSVDFSNSKSKAAKAADHVAGSGARRAA